MDKSVLITGCSSGIGYAAAHGLRARGWIVFATCRNEADCERLRSEGFDAPRLDYCDAASIKAAVEHVQKATGGRLAALFNNGAFACPGAVEDVPTDALRAVFESNVFGLHELTRAVLPIMRAQGSGRVVNCSSFLGFVSLPWRGTYNASKHALEGLTDTLRLEMRGTGIHIITMTPGPITSRIRENSIPHFEKWIDWRKSPRAGVYEAMLIPRLYDDSGPDRFELPPEAVVRKLIHALEAQNPRPRYYVTTPTYVLAALRRLLPTRMLDRILAKG